MNFMTADHVQNARAFPNASSGGFGLFLDKHHRNTALERVALRSAVTEPRADVAQIAALADLFAAKPTETLPEWRPAIHQYEFHVVPPSSAAKQ
jgi:hypothetical protein